MAFQTSQAENEEKWTSWGSDEKAKLKQLGNTQKH